MLWNEIEEKQKMLDKAINELAQNGYDLAEKERDYRVALCKTALELKASGIPATLIQIIIYGYGDVPNYRFKRDKADVKYKTNQEYINDTKLNIRILESQLSREYGNAK